MIQYLLAAGLGALIGDANKGGGKKKSYAKGGRLPRVGDTVSFNEGVTAYSPISGRVIDVVGSVLTVKDAIGKEHKVRSGDIFEIIEKVTDYDWERPKMAQGGMTITQAVRDVEKAKKKLIGQAKRKGISENFGQKEVRDLSDKYGREMFSFSIEGQEIRRLIDDFDSWAMDFSLSDLARFDSGGQTMSEFIAFYGGEKKILEATSLLDARDKAREAFRVPKSKRGLLSVMSKQSYDNQDFRMYAKGGQVKTYEVSNIKYDTDGEDIDLPESLTIVVPADFDGYEADEYISDKISDMTGFAHFGFSTTPEIEYAKGGKTHGMLKYFIGDEGMFKGGEFRIKSYQSYPNRYSIIQLDEDGNEIGKEYAINQKDFEDNFSKFARGGRTKRIKKGGKTKREEYVANLPEHERWELVRDITDRSIEEMDSDALLGALFEYGHHDLERKFVGRDKALQKAHDDDATFDLPTMNFSTSEFAKGGIATAEIDDFGKNVLGTASFDLKVKGTMRKPQNFTVYPMSGDTDKIYIQSKNRMGAIDPKTGRGAISKAHNFAGFRHLQHDISVGDATYFLLSGSQLTKLKDAIRGTFQKEAYSNKGAIGIDNRGSRSFARGGKIKDIKVFSFEDLHRFVDEINRLLPKKGKGYDYSTYIGYLIEDTDDGRVAWETQYYEDWGDYQNDLSEHEGVVDSEGQAIQAVKKSIIEMIDYWRSYILDLNPSYAKGGTTKKKRKKVSDFDKLAMKVASRYRGQPVEEKYQKEYGKRYDNEEAMEVGRKVAAKVARQQMAKKRR